MYSQGAPKFAVNYINIFYMEFIYHYHAYIYIIDREYSYMVLSDHVNISLKKRVNPFYGSWIHFYFYHDNFLMKINVITFSHFLLIKKINFNILPL